jgi:hypothetical protein
MYFLGKIFQAAGLGIILIAFIAKFPRLMDPKIFIFAIALFILGWGINFLLFKK